MGRWGSATAAWRSSISRRTGHQPMATSDGLFHLTYNGEFYNHATSADGWRPRVPVPRHLRHRNAARSAERLRAADPRPTSPASSRSAFWDSPARRLILARDPLGVKQLYYHDDGRRIVFAQRDQGAARVPGRPARARPRRAERVPPLPHPAVRPHVLQGHPAGAGRASTSRSMRYGVRRRRYAETDGFQPRDEEPGREHRRAALAARRRSSPSS